MSGLPDIIGPITLPLRIEGRVLHFSLTLYTFSSRKWICGTLGNCSDGTPVALRIESACLFGHVFHSAQCDCGIQFNQALSRIAALGRGIVVFGADDDARGLGLAAHFEIYRLRQQERLDTDEVYRRLDAPVDARDYAPVGAILRHQAVQSVVLMSNNKVRRQFLIDQGFEVKTESAQVPLDQFNMGTLMLEKEDLPYDWTFPTHTNWLWPLQRKVDGRPDEQGVVVVANNRDVIFESIVPHWDVASEVSRYLPMNEGGDFLVAYLSDLPRRDEIPTYSVLGIKVIVIPAKFIPPWLRETGRAHGIVLQDWERRNNTYSSPRPALDLVYEHNGLDVYLRGDRVKYVFSNAAFERVRPLLNRFANEPIRSPATGSRWIDLLANEFYAVPTNLDDGLATVTAEQGGRVLHVVVPVASNIIFEDKSL